MAPTKDREAAKRVLNRGAWTAEEDRTLPEYIATHGAKRWKTLATKSGLNRCGKSCRLRWLNYLRPNMKRGNISLDEEDLIFRLHKLLGNRWSLIAGRLPGRTDNEIKNYWNSHLSKRMNQPEETTASSEAEDIASCRTSTKMGEGREESIHRTGDVKVSSNLDDFLDFSREGTYGLEWVNKFLELDKDT